MNIERYSSIMKYVLFSIGFKWDRRLNYRGKLTMHTAYERKENPSPAAVTALGISKYVY